MNGLVDGTSIEVGNDGPDASGGLGLFDFTFSRRRSLLHTDVADPAKTAARHHPSAQRAQDWDEDGATNDDYGSFVLADHDDMEYMPATTAIPDLDDDEDDNSAPWDSPEEDSPVPAQGFRPPPPPPGAPPPTARGQPAPPASLVRYGINAMNMENIVTFWTQHNRCSDTRMTADNLVRSLQVFADASQVSKWRITSASPARPFRSTRRGRWSSEARRLSHVVAWLPLCMRDVKKSTLTAYFLRPSVCKKIPGFDQR